MTPRKIIESSKNPRYEHSYVKFPKKKIEDVTDSEQEEEVATNWSKVGEISKRNKNRRYTHVHTHPVLDPEEHYFAHIPSPQDMQNFIFDDKEKTAIIAKTNAYTGELEGYTFLRKTKNTPRSGYNRLPGFYNSLKNIFSVSSVDRSYLDNLLRKYSYKCDRALEMGGLKDLETAVKVLAKELNFQYRFVPAKKSSGIVRSNSGKLEEATTVAASILGLVGGAFFLSSNMTGNVIGLSSSSSNIIGSVLLVIGLVACFSWVKSKKSKVVKKKKK